MAFTVDYDGIGQNTSVTFKHTVLTKDVHEGRPVKMLSNDTVGLAADGDPVIGFIRSIEKDACTVALNGFFEVSYTGTAPTLGFSRLACDASGGVKVGASTDRFHLVVRVDTAASKVTFFMK